MGMSEKDIDALTLVMERFNRAESYCKAWHDNGAGYYERYRFYKRTSKYPFKHNVKDRLTFTIVEVLASRIMKTLFAVQPFISIVPTEKEDVAIAKQVEKVIHVLLSNPDREFFLEFLDFVKQNLIYGTSFLSVTPRFDLKNWKFDGLNFDCEEYMDVFPDPAAKRLSRAKFVLKRSIRYWDELKELEKKGIYKNVDDIQGDTVADWDHKLKERLGNIGLMTGVDYQDPETGEVEILDYFEEGQIITVGARKVILRDTRRKEKKEMIVLDTHGNPNLKSTTLPYDLPFVDLRFVPVPREFFGIGIPEILQDDQDYIDIIRSQRLDNIDLAINKLFKLRISSDTDPDSIFAAPGGIIPVTDMNDIEEFRISDVTGSAYQEVDSCKRTAEDSVGEWGYGRGETPQQRETATGIVKLQEATLIRFDLAMKLHEFTAVRTIGKKIVQMMREYMDVSQYERILGEKDEGFYNYTIDDLLNVIDIVPVGTSITANKETRTQQIQNAYKMLSGLDPNKTRQNKTPFVVDLFPLNKLALDDLDIKNWAEILVKEEGQPQAPPQQPMPQGGAGGQPTPARPPMPGGMPPGGAPPQGMPQPNTQQLLQAAQQPRPPQMGGFRF